MLHQILGCEVCCDNLGLAVVVCVTDTQHACGTVAWGPTLTAASSTQQAGGVVRVRAVAVAAWPPCCWWCTLPCWSGLAALRYLQPCAGTLVGTMGSVPAHRVVWLGQVWGCGCSRLLAEGILPCRCRSVVVTGQHSCGLCCLQSSLRQGCFCCTGLC